MVIENNLRLDNKTIIVTGTSGHIESLISSSLSMLGADLSKWLASSLAPKIRINSIFYVFKFSNMEDHIN